MDEFRFFVVRELAVDDGDLNLFLQSIDLDRQRVSSETFAEQCENRTEDCQIGPTRYFPSST